MAIILHLSARKKERNHLGGDGAEFENEAEDTYRY